MITFLIHQKEPIIFSLNFTENRQIRQIITGSLVKKTEEQSSGLVIILENKK